MYEFDRMNLSVDSECGLMVFDGDSIAAILEPKLDVTEKLRLTEQGLSADDITISVVAYADGSLISAQFTSCKGGEEEHFACELSEGEEEKIWELLEDFCQQTYGCSLKDYPGYDLRIEHSSMQEVSLT